MFNAFSAMIPGQTGDVLGGIGDLAPGTINNSVAGDYHAAADAGIGGVANITAD